MVKIKIESINFQNENKIALNTLYIVALFFLMQMQIS